MTSLVEECHGVVAITFVSWHNLDSSLVTGHNHLPADGLCPSSLEIAMNLFARVCVAMTTTLAGAVSLSVSAAQPNVVLILSDDQHWGDYGFMGHEHLRTPAIDRLAAESLVFTRGYVTSSLCCPSLASLITGRYPHEHKIVGNDPPGARSGKTFEDGRETMTRHLEAWPTLPKLLGQHGYKSLQTGKWWQGNFKRGGFDEGMTKGQRHGDEGLSIGRKSMEPLYDFVKRCRADEKPFFVWYAPMLPHDPHDPPAGLVEHYASKTDSIHVARYWGNVERFDNTVGDLLDFLDKEKLSADTLVVYVTDNGWIQNRDRPKYAPRSKCSPYDGGLRTPIMLRQPGTIAPATSDALASSLDILPTMLAACGVPAPDGLPGLNLLDAEKVAARKQIFGECYTHTLVDLEDPAQSLMWRWTVRRDGDHLWKLVEPVTARSGGGKVPKVEEHRLDADDRARYERGDVELFDVGVDPAESKNLVASHAKVVKELQASLDAWWNFRGPAHASKEAARDSHRVRHEQRQSPGWPNWRGAGLDGVASGDGYVTEWAASADAADGKKNVVWRVTLPGLGGSTPAVWGESIVLTCGVAGKDAALCFDRAGQERWRRLLGAERPGKHKKATGANSSPVTDGEHVWVYFKSGELACLALADGAVVWKTNLQEQFGKDTLWWDLGTSPVLSKKAVIIAVMQEGPSYLVAFDRVTGKVLWKQDRMLDAPKEATQSYSTPLVLAGDKARGEPEEMLVILGADHVTAHDAADGRELWRVGGLNPTQDGFFRSIASPVAIDGLIIAPYARGNSITAIRRGGAGDVTDTHVAWVRNDIGSDVPTPAAINGSLVVCTDKGRVAGLDASTGKTAWETELPKNRNAFSSSPVIVAGHVIVTREDGESWILGLPQQGVAEPSMVGTGTVDEMTVATPVCVDGRIFLRTHDSLWCLGSR